MFFRKIKNEPKENKNLFCESLEAIKSTQDQLMTIITYGVEDDVKIKPERSVSPAN